ncbi:MAG: PIN domain-containing protein [Nitrospirota bacterium]|nr:PIN domain-containing protein [Nitrospirota bacterium]
MNLVVDTSVWSLVLRRPQVEENNPFVQAFRFHVTQEDGLVLIGNILQELLDGVKSQRDFQRLLTLLEPFPLLDLTRETYVAAAQLRNTCRSKGVQAGPIDFLIASVCIEHGFPLLTADRDFSYIAHHSDLIVVPTPP